MATSTVITRGLWETKHGTAAKTAVSAGWVVAVRVMEAEGWSRSAVLCSKGLAESVHKLYASAGIEAEVVPPTDAKYAKAHGG